MAWIKANLLTDGNRFETVGFPCSDDEIMRLTEQSKGGRKATVFINYLIDPKGLKSIEGTYANIHELNYLAKRMDSFDVTEMEKLLAAATYFDIRDLKQLINYTFNLYRITLIQNIASMQTVGVEHYLDLNGGGCTNEEFYNPQRAEEGRALLNSKRGIWTDYGLMFINNEVPWEEVYNGITFPEYLYAGPEESSVAICHGGRTEFVYPPCEQSSIEFALERLGADSLDDCHIQLSCSRFGKPLSELTKHILNDEGLEAFNEVCHAAAKIPEQEMDKFTAAVLYADADTADAVCRIAGALEFFMYVPKVQDMSSLGAWWLDNKENFSLPYEIDQFFDYAAYGRSVVEESNGGTFVDGIGFVGMAEDCSLEDILPAQGQGMGGMTL